MSAPGRRRAVRGRLMLLAAALAATGCSGMLMQTKPAAVLYGLSPRPGVRGPAVEADLKILPALVPAGIDSDRIAAVYPDGHVDHFAASRWSAPLARTIGDLAVAEFLARSGLRNVVPDESTLQPRFWIEIEVVSFAARYDGPGAPTVEVHCVARVGDNESRGALARIEVRESRTAADNRMGPIVAAFDAAATAALERIVTRTDRVIAGRLARPAGG
ncbi:MAG: membrane integrity-associated transporter subunit PqiC [Gammaproteobacteria bacterium]|nr:membrane integrity-associated transporter subunit PqiC [Gammaproteobacteria bacterium]